MDDNPFIIDGRFHYSKFIQYLMEEIKQQYQHSRNITVTVPPRIIGNFICAGDMLASLRPLLDEAGIPHHEICVGLNTISIKSCAPADTGPKPL